MRCQEDMEAGQEIPTELLRTKQDVLRRFGRSMVGILISANVKEVTGGTVCIVSNTPKP